MKRIYHEKYLSLSRGEVISYDEVVEDYEFSIENDYSGYLEGFINSEYKIVEE